MQKKLLSQALTSNDLEVTQETQEKILQYLDLLSRWNKVYNLTAITDPHEMVWLHIIDSLSINPYLKGQRIIDVGTGAGLPGIPLALIHPDKQFVLLDSNSKKTRFLTQAIAELPLKNVEVIHARVEEFKPTLGFDSILSRAFSAIQVMLAKTQHLLAPHGQFIAMKGIYPEQELTEIPAGYRVAAVHKLNIKGLLAERHVVCIERL